MSLRIALTIGSSVILDDDSRGGAEIVLEGEDGSEDQYAVDKAVTSRATIKFRKSPRLRVNPASLLKR